MGGSKIRYLENRVRGKSLRQSQRRGDHLLGRQVIGPQNVFPRTLRIGNDPAGPAHGGGHCEVQQQTVLEREPLRIEPERDVMDGGDDRAGGAWRYGVLHMHQVGTVRMPQGAPWPHLDQGDDERISMIGIQTSDGARAAIAVGRNESIPETPSSLREVNLIVRTLRRTKADLEETTEP